MTSNDPRDLDTWVRPTGNVPRAVLPPNERIVQELRGEALAYFVVRGEGSPVGEWLWRLADSVEAVLCPVPDNVVQLPQQRRQGKA